MKRKRALLESNSPRNSQLETHRSDGAGGAGGGPPSPAPPPPGAGGVALRGREFPPAWKTQGEACGEGSCRRRPGGDGFKFRWRPVSERRMQAAAVVIFLNELADMGPQVFQMAISVAGDFLLLERADKALALSVVVGVSRPAHAGRDSVLG